MTARGFTRKRGRTWSWYLETVDPATGKRRQLSKGGHRTKAEALEGLDEARLAHTATGYTGPRRLTVAGFVMDEWLPTVNKRPNTVASYRS